MDSTLLERRNHGTDTSSRGFLPLLRRVTTIPVGVATLALLLVTHVQLLFERNYVCLARILKYMTVGLLLGFLRHAAYPLGHSQSLGC